MPTDHLLHIPSATGGSGADHRRIGPGRVSGRAAWAATLVFLLLACSSGPALSQITYLDNGVIRVGVDLERGGAISYLGEHGSGSSVVNIYDLGRYIQQSYYSGPDPFIPPGATQHPAYAGWGWNPVQAGDVYGYPSAVIDSYNDGSTIYAMSVPKQWALRNVDSECTMEVWVTLDENRVHVRNRLVNARNDTTRYGGRHQELPAIYTVGTLHRLFTYTGSAPFTGDGLTQIHNSGPPWAYWNSTENWSALVDNNDWGLGVFLPGATLTVGGFAGSPGWGWPASFNTGYISPLHTDLIDHDIVYEYEYTLILGDLHADIRSYACANAPAPGPNLLFHRDRGHCLPRHLSDSSPPFDGFWRLILDQHDPQVTLPPGMWDASDVPRIYIQAACSTATDHAEIFFALEDGTFSGDRRVQFTVIPDGQVRTFQVDLHSHPLYSGAITRLRFDPIISAVAGDFVDLHSITSVDPASVPAVRTGDESFLGIEAETCRPNPFLRDTRIRFRLEDPAQIDLRIHDATGRLVRTLARRAETPAGVHEMVWCGLDASGRPAPSGQYFFRLETAEGAAVGGRMLRIR